MNKLRSVKGMHDILPQESGRWQFLEKKYVDLVRRYGYGEIRTPVLEPLALFCRGIGENTDIVEKEMYAFVDKGQEHLALRPEGTASVIRSYIQHNLGAQGGLQKLYYMGPMFRRERPARGRYRQFFQAGAELIGSAEAASDAEVIAMVVHFLNELGIEQVNVQINSLGDDDSRPAYRTALVAHFSRYKADLCPDCVRRLDVNPLRILDCKVPACKVAGTGAPVVLDYLNKEARAHYEELNELLRVYDVPFSPEPRMVRGLDYYTRTIFEVQGGDAALGAQSTLVGGGRYNGLVAQLGGRSTPTVGFAFGVERLLMMMDAGLQESRPPVVFVAGVGDGGFARTVRLSNMLRKAGVCVESSYKSTSLRGQMKQADRCGAKLAVIAGEAEAQQGKVTVKELSTGEQQQVEIVQLEKRIRELL